MSQILEKDRELIALIGGKLRMKRESMGISLRDISISTRINQSFLEKIEKGDLQSLPGVAFVKGFIRNYQQAVQLVDEEFEEAVKQLGQAELSRSHLPSEARTNPFEMAEPRGNVPLIAGAAILVLVLVWIVVMLVRSGDSDDEAVPVAQTTQTEQAPAASAADGQQQQAGQAQDGEPVASDNPGEGQQGAKETAADAYGADGQNQPGQGAPQESADAARQNTGAGQDPSRNNGKENFDGRQKLKLTIRGLEPTWVRLIIDRAPPVDVLMKPAETAGWNANEEILLTIGKSHGVAVYLNGEDVILPKERNRLLTNIPLNRLTLLKLEN
ncbi:MAG: helix-turn-helix domain-containing protein [Deltaproteobacteria bacterium]|nr:helix-turn-helix domain-containing protein [Deltaproteobacteria bacterium]